MARLQLDLSETHEAIIERLMPLCDLKTKKDVIENALILMVWAATETSKGLSIAAVDEQRKAYKEVHTSALEGARHFNERRSRSDKTSASTESKIQISKKAVFG